MSNFPRIVIEGPTSQPRVEWRVVIDRRPDEHGVLREVRIVELHDGTLDGMGTKIWRRVRSDQKATMSDWILVAEAALDLALQVETEKV